MGKVFITRRGCFMERAISGIVVLGVGTVGASVVSAASQPKKSVKITR